MAVTTLARAAAGLIAIAGVAYLLVTTLPAPRPDEKLAVRVLYVLDHNRGTGAHFTVGGRSFRATCRKLPPWRSLVKLSDGSRLILSGTRVRAAKRRSALREPASRVHPELLAAQADLAGSYGLYASQLRSRLVHRRPILGAASRLGATPVYEIRLGRDRPRVALLVDRDSLEPLAARYTSARLSGTSRLLPSVPGRRNRNGC